MYLRKRLIEAIFVGCMMACLPAFCQPANPAKGLDPELVRFLTGQWAGEGEFAQGRKIAADLSFRLSLDSCWLVCDHKDRAPNRYAASSMWGVDRETGEFVAWCFDNFRGHRQFVSNGWKNGRLILSSHTFMPPAGLYFEHFIYEEQAGGKLKITYETSRDGINWQLGDWLVFTKKTA